MNADRIDSSPLAVTRPVRLLRRLFLVAGAGALLCIPGILLSEAGRIPIHESVFHVSQLLLTTATFVASGAFLFASRAPRAYPSAVDRPLAWIAMAGSGAWLSFVLFVVWILSQGDGMMPE